MNLRRVTRDHVGWKSRLQPRSVELRGWVPQPNTRGTLDIIWSCASTIFVCVWVMLHLNVPARKDGEITRFIRKLKWFTLAMLAPELVMLFAGGQWASARRSIDEMKDIGVEGWSCVHAFYADSGGLVVQLRCGAMFPVTAKQTAYLVKRGIIGIPTITKDEIWDKSKADLFAKVIAALQSAWFVVQIIARAMSRLPVTLLELSTITLMCCTAMTLFFWFHKPLNIETPTMIKCDTTVREILASADETAKIPWHETPLDFVESLDYTSSKMPFSAWWGEQERPLPRIPNDRDSLLHSWKIVLAISVPTAAFGTFQLIPWNFAFPTRIEQMIWRYTTLGNGVVLGVGCALEAAAIVASNYTIAGLHTYRDYKLRRPWNLFFFIPGAMYFGARIVVIVEVIIGLRALSPGCFDTVQWTSIFPHV